MMNPPLPLTINSTSSSKYIREFTVEDKDQEENAVAAGEIVAAIVAGQEVLIRNARITGPFDLDSKTINGKITIEDSSFDGPFAASCATFNQLVSFKGSTFLFDHQQDSSSVYSLTFKTATFAKGLLVENAIFKGEVDFTNATLLEFIGSAATFEQGVFFEDIHLTKSMHCSNAVFKGALTVTGEIGGLADFSGVHFANAESTVRFESVQIKGHAFFHAVELDGQLQPAIFAGEVDFLNMQVGGQANFRGVHFTKAEATVSFESVQIKGNAFFNSDGAGDEVKPTLFAGGVTFVNMRVGGLADFSGTHFANNKATVSFVGTQSEGNVTFTPVKLGSEVQPTIFAGEVDFLNMRVGGHADFGGAHFTKAEATVGFESVQIRGHAFFRPVEVDGQVQPTVFAGGASFIDMHVGGEADFQGVRFSNNRARVGFEIAQIEGNITFSPVELGDEVQPTHFAGEASFANMRIKGQADFGGVHFANNKATVSFAGAQIEGNITFSPVELGDKVQPTIFDGGASFIDMRVEGQADFSQVEFNNPQKTVSFDSAHFGTNVYFVGTIFEGPVQFNVLRAQNNVFLTDATFAGGVSFDNAHIEQQLDLTGAAFSRNIDLKDSHVGVIEFGQDSLTILDEDNEKTFIDLRGTHYTRFTPDKVWKELTNRFDPEKYNRQPYTQLEYTLRQAGNDNMADEVYMRRQKFEASQLLRRDVPEWWRNIPKRILRWFHWFLAGYGVRTFRLVLLSVAVVLFGWWVFLQPGAVISASSTADPNPILCTDSQLDWQDAFMLSLTTFLPVTFPIDDIFIPSFCQFTLPILNFTLQFIDVANFMIFFGWILVPVGIATLSGFLKR